MEIEKANTQDKNIPKGRFFSLLLTSHFLPNKKGQVAVILVLVVAAALIFYAVSLNLSRVSQAKTVTTIAANTGAAMMGSYMASYGQQVLQTSLGGNRRICGWTGVIAAIFAVVVAIIAVIAVFFCPPCAAYIGPAFIGAAQTLAVASVVFAAAALTLQLTVIQPGMSSMWNDYILTLMEPKDAFVEQGVQTALSAAVTDQVAVPDATDFDQDRIFGFDINGNPLDVISRFGFYYQKRLDTIPPLLDVPVEDFLTALRGFIYNDGDGWGIVDGFGAAQNDLLGPSCTPFDSSSECDPCCVGDAMLRPPDICGTPADPSDPSDPINLARQAECEANSPYGSAYPWVYDPYRGYPGNGFDSFQEQIGRDDEHQLFEKNPADPNGVQISRDPQCVAGCLGDAACEAACPPATPPPALRTDCMAFCGVDLACQARCPPHFKLKDTTKFYTPPVYPGLPPADNRVGIYPFFYKIADWKVNLDSVLEPFDLVAKPHQCHWCDSEDLARGSGTVGACPGNQPLEALQLDLPVDPLSLTYNRTFCVDGANLIAGNPPLAVDRVRLPDVATGLIEATPDQCAQRALGNPAVGFWKRGGDRFCSGTTPTTWPYYGGCPKEGTCTDEEGCACRDAGTRSPENWPDDLLDDLVYGLNDFADWARGLLAQDTASMVRNFNNWYPEAAQWIERAGASNSPTCTSCCYMCAAEEGMLWQWYDEIRDMKARLEAWRDTSFAGASCTDVWCVPSGGCPGGRDSTAMGGLGLEENTFDSNGNGTRGDFADVVACLNWNVNDLGGNDAKFTQCRAGCLAGGNYAQADTWCARLPRSLVPGFDAGGYTATQIADLITCRDVTCPACVAGCAGAAACIAACTCTAYATIYSCSGGAIPAAIASEIAAGSCANPAFMADLQQSIREAQNQVAKFRKRHAFLSARLRELNEMITIFTDAENKFYEFLTCDDGPDAGSEPDGAACRLIRARINQDDRKTGLPYHAVYAWQNAAERGQPPDLGKWHIVRADARIPKRCDRSCNADQIREGGDPAWPWVRTYTKNWGTKRCYELTSTTGVVKVRVSRYDETNTFATLLFPNAVEIWKPSFTRTDRPERASPDDIEAACIQHMTPDLCTTPPCPLAPGTHYYGAFLLNERLLADPDVPTCRANCAGDLVCEANCLGNGACWNLTHDLLTQGVTTEACAQYYYHGGSEPGASGMDFKFVPCANF